MEGFELINTGVWSIIPPLLALGLALATKEVYSSLFIGIFSGMIIYEFTLDGAGLGQLIDSFTMVPMMMAEQIGANGALLLFLALLGALVVVVALAGGSRAYGEWVSTHIKSARTAQLLTAILGILIFIDDYFNCLTVGAVMRPVTDRFNISREKLAWIIDSCAAPVCIIAPISSWAVAVGGYLGDNGFATFVAAIPYNFYALLTIFFVFFMCFVNVDYGPMAKAQRLFKEYGPDGPPDVDERPPSEATVLEVLATSGIDDASPEAMAPPPNVPTVVAEESTKEAAIQVEESYGGLPVSDKGRVYDLVVPVITLIVFAILGMAFTGGFFDSTNTLSLAEAIGEDPISGLNIGATVALIVAAAMFLPRGLMKLAGFMEGVAEGVRSMIGAIMILVLAWSLGGMCRYMLGTGEFVAGFLNSVGVDLAVLPFIIFIVAALIGFAMGTSWGTIALILPIVVGVFPGDSEIFLVAIGAALGGAVLGDHTSPISDTTILSSAGASCDHLQHVSTQIPYALTVGGVSLICTIVSAVLGNPWVGLCLGVVLVVTAVLCFSRFSRARD